MDLDSCGEKGKFEWAEYRAFLSSIPPDALCHRLWIIMTSIPAGILMLCLFLFTPYRLFINPLHPFLFICPTSPPLFSMAGPHPSAVRKYQRCALTMPVDLIWDFLGGSSTPYNGVSQSVLNLSHVQLNKPTVTNPTHNPPNGTSSTVAVKRTINCIERAGCPQPKTPCHFKSTPLNEVYNDINIPYTPSAV